MSFWLLVTGKEIIQLCLGTGYCLGGPTGGKKKERKSERKKAFCVCGMSIVCGYTCPYGCMWKEARAGVRISCWAYNWSLPFLRDCHSQDSKHTSYHHKCSSVLFVVFPIALSFLTCFLLLQIECAFLRNSGTLLSTYWLLSLGVIEIHLAFKSFIIIIYVLVWIIGPGVKVVGSCELSDVGSGNHCQVLCKSSKQS